MVTTYALKFGLDIASWKVEVAMNNIFKISTVRKSQKTISNRQARNLITHILMPVEDKGSLRFVGKNGKTRGWVIGSVTQLLKDKPWGSQGFCK